MPTDRQSLGARGEALAAGFYLERGYEVVARNWRSAGGEIDLVVRRGRELVFCEVKTRLTDRFGTPAEAVTQAKQRRIRRLATAYLVDLERREDPDASRTGTGQCAGTGASRPGLIRFDVACVSDDKVEVIEEAF